MSSFCNGTKLTSQILLFVPLLLLFLNNNVAFSTAKFTPVQVHLNYSNESTTYSINSSVEYIIEFTGEDLPVPPRVHVQSSSADSNSPLMVVSRQMKQVLSWQVPLVVESQNGDKDFSNTSRTLCFDILKHNRYLIDSRQHSFMVYDNPIVTVSTASNKTIDFSINVNYQYDFRLNLSQEINFEISPSEPRYYFYNFTQKDAKTKMEALAYNFDTVILEVNSNDSVCTTVSIQNVSCPVFDLNQDITFRGFYETISTKGGITIPKNKFPYGFYIVFVAKSDDQDCTRGTIPSVKNRTKKLSMIIKPSITFDDYVYAVLLTLISIGAFYVIFGIGYFICTKRYYFPPSLEYVVDAGPHDIRRLYTISQHVEGVNTGQSEPMGSTNDNQEYNHDSPDSQSLDEMDYDVLEETQTDRSVRLGRSQLFLTDLARKHPKVLRKKSYLYFYNVLTVAVFYGLPVVQLVVTYQRMLNETGQQDLCYYNFLCAHPLGFLSDFNHVFSNIGYVLLGILFLIITYFRERAHNDINFDKHFGIPQHYGLFYAMGVALIMEGVLSGSYHVCPSQTNFQFDSSFMYVMAVLCMIKLYQNRHPDINATAYSTFGVLAIAILLGMIGIFEGTLYFYIFFIILHLHMCLYVSIKVYYMGCWKLNKTSIRNFWHIAKHDFWSGPLNVLKPCYKARFTLLLLGNICNWTLAFCAIYFHPKNFAVFLLGVFLANTMLYFTFYIIMKYLNKERVKFATWIFLVMMTLCAVSAMYFFMHKAISWSRTAAQSRQFNTGCKMLRFYDYHDIWHFLSAIGMFFTFMVLLTLDDDLSHTHHSRIPVF